MIDTYDYDADATLLAQAYATAQINGVDASNVGLVPGALVKLSAANKVALAGSQAGDTAIMEVLGILMSSAQPAFSDPAASSGFSINRALNNRVAVLPISESIVEIEAYMLKSESGATLTYAAGDKLFRSKFGFLTKDSATGGKPHCLGQVLEVTAAGTLRVQLFRTYTT
jgi:hypothetical protein